MKRSAINGYIKEAERLLADVKWKLPPFASFTPEEWCKLGHEYDEIRECALGWDITDFGSGDYEHTGLFLFTVRNGNLAKPTGKTYAEKIMLVKENQVTPCHFHWSKLEDIINRGGGNLMVKVYNANPDDSLSEQPVEVSMDGCKRTVPAGTVLRLTPGESITMHRRLYHAFWGEPGHGAVIVGEVSMTNDDNADNRFYEPAGRFPAIDEDEPAYRLLCNEYPAAKD